MAFEGDKPTQYPGSDELSDNEAHVRVACKVDPETQRENLGGVGWSRGGEDTPWQTAEQPTTQEGRLVGSEEDDEDEGGESGEAVDQGLLLAESLDKPAVEKDAEEGTDTVTVVEAGLPGCREL